LAYKNLLGPGQNMSHVPGADVDAQEINTVADMVNFEVKKKMYRRFSTGFGVFMIAQLCEWRGGQGGGGGPGGGRCWGPSLYKERGRRVGELRFVVAAMCCCRFL
jgi:hypothetical protein